MTGIKHRDHKNLCNCFMRLLLLSVVYWIIQIHGKTGQKIPTKSLLCNSLSLPADFSPPLVVEPKGHRSPQKLLSEYNINTGT